MDKKTAAAVKAKFDEWRAKRIPATASGKNLVVKNSVLSKVWYLVSNQSPPDGIDKNMRE